MVDKGKRPPGRPPVEIDMEQLGVICRLKPSKDDCAAFFKCSLPTIDRAIKDEFGDDMTFKEFRHINMVNTRFNLIRNAIQKAEAGDTTMLIFSLKNLCDWADKSEITNAVEFPDKITYVEK